MPQQLEEERDYIGCTVDSTRRLNANYNILFVHSILGIFVKKYEIYGYGIIGFYQANKGKFRNLNCQYIENFDIHLT